MTVNSHPIQERIRRVRRAIRARKPLEERLELVRKHAATRQDVQVRIEGDPENSVQIRINENA